jgi:hypothetical protein
MTDQLDLTNPIVNKEMQATAYFEDIMFGVFQASSKTPVPVTIDTGIATVDLSKGGQFNITATDDFEIDVIGFDGRSRNINAVTITNPAGAFDLTDITAPVGVTISKSAGSTISILGGDLFTFLFITPDTSSLQVIPFEMEPL